MNRTYDLHIVDNALEVGYEKKKKKNFLYVRKQDHHADRFRVEIYVIGSDLPYVSAVTYRLHPSFGENRTSTIRRIPSNPNCRFTIWTWGIFTVKVIIRLKSGEIIVKEHELNYHQDLRDVKVISSSRNTIHGDSTMYEVELPHKTDYLGV